MPYSIDSNSTQAYYGEETTLGTQSPGPFFPLEPNSYSDWGVDTKTVQRSTLNISRQQAKGTITEQDVAAGFASDYTQNNLFRLLQGFFFADVLEKPDSQPMNGAATAVSSAGVGAYTLAAALSGLQVGHIIAATGFNQAANNNQATITALNGGALTVASLYGDVQAAENNPPATARISAVGYQLSANATVSGLLTTYPVLTDTGGVDFTTLGLTPGEWVYIGDVGNSVAAQSVNFIGSVTGSALRGYARITANGITPTELTFDFVTFGGVTDPAGATQAGARLWFGSHLRNQTTLATIKRRSYTMPRYLGQGIGGVNQLETLMGCVPDKFTLNIAQTTKLVADLTFIGTGFSYSNLSMLPGTVKPFYDETAINTSQDLFASLLTVNGQVDSTLFAYASEAKFMIDNGAAGAKALARTTPFDIEIGDFKVTGSATVYFDDIRAIQAVQTNADVGLLNIFASRNAGTVFDIPLMTLGGGKPNVEKDKKITLPLTTTGNANIYGSSASVTQFKYLPAPAMSGYLGV